MSAKRGEPTTRFLLAWILPSWIVFELATTKLPHYVLPLYPAIAILIATAIETNALSSRRWLVRGTVWWFLVPIMISIVFVAGAMLIDRQLVFPAWPFLAAAIACGLVAWRWYEDSGAGPAFAGAVAVSALIAIAVYALIFPALSPLFPSATLARVLRDSGCANPVAASVGYEEPSLVFLAGTATQFTSASGAVDFLQQGGCRFAFIEAAQEPAFMQRAAAIGLRFEEGPPIRAFNLGRVQPITIAVFRSRPAP
jgi:4-amino-4-deoxy-L-arabinose transferase-like glycosyltransferase